MMVELYMPEDLEQNHPGWYLSLMAPNVKGNGFAWLDPTRIYMFSESLKACVEDLAEPFRRTPIDLVAGIDAMGLILGSAMANILGAGFLTLRKGGQLCVRTNVVDYQDYQGKPKQLEIRRDPFPSGTRVLIVDQWVETGGTMTAAAQLVEKSLGTVAGISAICIEESDGGKRLKEKYKYSCAPISAELQTMINQHECGFMLRQAK